MSTKPKDPTTISWPLLFIVTAASFFLFGGVTKLLEGDPMHISIFFKVGIAAAGLSLVTFISNLFSSTAED